MILSPLYILPLFIAISFTDDRYVLNNKKFPKDFMFGVATSSYQVEGAWNEDGKGENIWDYLVHNSPEKIDDYSTGDIACDSYHRINEDVAMLKELGVNHYRFSLSWTRILPKGTPDYINKEGVQYYKNLINVLNKNNITPLVTIFHWDTPQVFEKHGGFLNDSIVEKFVDYARVCFELFGDDVKWWLTFNEPKQTCYGGYGAGYMAPMIKDEAISDYICAHNVLKAHGKVYHLYNETFKPKHKGKISITLDTSFYLPKTNSPEDIEAVERLFEFDLGWFANAIYKSDYPEVMKKRVAARSKAEGFKKSRLPEFSLEEIEYIKDTHDFFGLNTYTSYMTAAVPEPGVLPFKPSRYGDIIATQETNPTWEAQVNGWSVYPLGIRHLLKYIKDKYNDPGIIITENGYTDYGGLNDSGRAKFYEGYISNVRDAMDKDNVTVLGYTAWSLMDNFEWSHGYTLKFGIYDVDFNSPNRTRTPKLSAMRYKEILRNRCVADNCIE